MSEERHTPEPWAIEARHGGGVIEAFVSGASRQVALATGNAPMHDVRGYTTTEIQSANVERIVACVNACAGIPTAALEDGAVVKMREALWGIRARLGSLGANANTDHYLRASWEIAHHILSALEKA